MPWQLIKSYDDPKTKLRQAIFTVLLSHYELHPAEPQHFDMALRLSRKRW